MEILFQEKRFIKSSGQILELLLKKDNDTYTVSNQCRPRDEEPNVQTYKDKTTAIRMLDEFWGNRVNMSVGAV